MFSPGSSRHILPVLATLLGLSLSPLTPRAQAATLTVTILSDTGSGSCNTSNCTLRDAITDANLVAGEDNIVFAAGLTGTVALKSALPTITQGLTITGPGAGSLTVTRDSAAQFRIFTVTSGPCTLSGLTLSNGRVPGFGGAINISDAQLNVNDCAFTGNIAGSGGAISGLNADIALIRCSFSNNTANDGGALALEDSTARIERCSFIDNGVKNNGGAIHSSLGSQIDLIESTIKSTTSSPAAGDGGGIYVESGYLTVTGSTISNVTATRNGGAICFMDGEMSATNLTLSGNTAGEQGGAVYAEDDLDLFNCTIAGNNAETGGGVLGFEADFNFGNCLFKAGTHGANLVYFGNDSKSQGNNLSDDSAAGLFTDSSDEIGVDPLLGPLADNGGPTQTRALLKGSPAIDAGDTSLEQDQRGVTRPQGKAPDIGAYEFDGYTESLVVTTLEDENNGTSDAGFGEGTSLREAIGYAQLHAGNDAITFAAGLSGTITLNGSLPEVTTALSITVPAGSKITLDAGYDSRIIHVTPTGDLTVSGLTFARGATAPEGVGGAIFARGSLTAESCTFFYNQANFGGAIYSVVDDAHSTVIRNCTFWENEAEAAGGAIFNNGGLTTLDSCTVTGAGNAINTGIASNDVEGAKTRTRLRNCIVAGNSGDDVQKYGATNTFVSDDYNLVGTGSGIGLINKTNDQIIGAANPQLGSLQDNGGRTATMAITVASKAFDKGQTDLTTDQRGLLRPVGPADIGAFEMQDDGPPKITATAPLIDATVTALPAISGTVKDITGVATLTVALARASDGKYWTGTEWGAAKHVVPTLSGTANNRTYTWPSGLPSGSALAPGNYTVIVTATDLHAFKSVLGYQFKVILQTKPSVTVSAPANNSYLKSLTTAGGTVNDATGGPGIAKVEISLKRQSDAKFWNGTAWVVAETLLPTGVSGASWSKSSFPAVGADVSTQMQEGKYLITAKATDKGGAVSAATATSKAEFTIDRTNPATLTIINPPVNAKIKVLPKINGTAMDNYAVASVVFTYKRNSDNKFWTGTAWGAETVFPTNLAGTIYNRTWSVSTGLPAGADLPLGNYGIFVTAIDGAGNKTTVPRSFNITETIPPTVTITTPANASTVIALTQITGTANDTGGSNLQKVSLTLRRNSDSKFWNGTAWVATSFELATSMTTATQGVTWKCLALPKNANLLDGVYRTVATATDKAGNDSSSVVSLFTLKRTTAAAAPIWRASNVQLSSASASASGTIQLVFTGALSGSSATDALNYGETLNGEAVEIVSAQQKSPSVVVLTTEGLTPGAKLAVDYSLQDTAGGSVAGTASVVVK